MGAPPRSVDQEGRAEARGDGAGRRVVRRLERVQEDVDERVGPVVLQVVVGVGNEVERVPARLLPHVLVPDVADDAGWRDRVVEAPDERGRYVHGGERLQPGVLVLRSLDEVLDRLVQDPESLAVGEDRGQRLDLGIVGAARRRVRRLSHAHRELLGRRLREQGGTRGRIEHQALGLGEVRQRQEDVAVRDEEVVEPHRDRAVVWIIATLEPRSWASMIMDSRPNTSAR